VHDCDDYEFYVIYIVLCLDQYEDQFERRSKDREERVAKNEFQRLRNLARDKKGKVKGYSFIVLFTIFIENLHLVPIPPTSQSWNKEQVCYMCTWLHKKFMYVIRMPQTMVYNKASVLLAKFAALGAIHNIQGSMNENTELYGALNSQFPMYINTLHKSLCFHSGVLLCASN